MKIVVTGTRGIPGIQGGVETHCQHLYPRMAAAGHDVTVLRRSCYAEEADECSGCYMGVKVMDVFAPRRKSLEAIMHTFLAVIKARRMNPDILHIHAVGPSLMVPFARMLGLKVVTTNHGPDYDRQKWGRLAKTMLKCGERMGAKFSNAVIVISRPIADALASLYGRRDTDLIYNGVEKPEIDPNTDYIDSLGIEPRKYVVTLGRFVPEKRFDDLIRAFAAAAPKGCKLVIAGEADHPDEYSRSLHDLADKNGVVLTGFIKGKKLNQLMSHAALFVLPSSHEGLPISLLEAMSYGIDVLASDIPANRIAQLQEEDFFAVGDTATLAKKITERLASPATPRVYDLSPYDWDNIARQTLAVYSRVLGSSGK